ncbi:MAG: hypothetical protein QOD88_3004 [Mycobacterium sp.]|jgi:transposase|nr:hypothetical protein [Mycobacterium sp.]
MKAADEPDDHAIGRSRGGLTTKIHALTDLREAPVAVRLTAGQAGDNPQLVPLLDDYAAACKQQGASGRDFRLLGDKAYSHPSTRTELRSRRIKHTIPQRSDQIARRKAKGSTGGRPPAFDAAVYGLRNTVERGFNRLKQWRGVATRYDCDDEQVPPRGRGLTRVTTGLRCLVFDLSTTDPGRCLLPSDRPGVSL